MESKGLIRLNQPQTTRSALSLLSDFFARDRVYRQFFTLFSSEKASYAVPRDMCHFHWSIMLLLDKVHTSFLLVVFCLFFSLSSVDAGEEKRKKKKNTKGVAMDKIMF